METVPFAEDDLDLTAPEDAVEEYFQSVGESLIFSASGPALKVYLLLLTHTGGNKRVAWPSRKRLAELMGLGSPGSVDRYLRELESLGAIEIKHRKRPDGGQMASSYRIMRNLKRARGAREEGASETRQGGGVKTGEQNLDLSKNLDKDLTSAPPRSCSSPPTTGIEILEGQVDAIDEIDSAESRWNEFWSTYPRKASKAGARKVWDRLVKKIDPAEIIAGARRYAADPNRVPEFTKHPTTWLNAGSWEDEPLPTRTTGPGAPPPDRAAAMWGVELPVDAEGMVTLPSGRRIPSGQLTTASAPALH